MTLALSLALIALGFAPANAETSGTPCSGQMDIKPGQQYLVADGRACHFVLPDAPALLILRGFSGPGPKIQIDGKDANVPINGNNYSMSLVGLGGKRLTILGQGSMEREGLQFELQTYGGLSACPSDKEIHRIANFALGPLALAYFDPGGDRDSPDSGSIHCLTTN